MRAMILAAGRGERMGALTSQQPKSLLKLNGHFLIEYALHNIQKTGIRDVIINVSYLGDQIKKTLGNGNRYGLTIEYSEETERLETGGGIYKALPLLGSDPFLVISSDIVTDFRLSTLPKHPLGLAHLVLVTNPSYHPRGDFGLNGRYLDLVTKPLYTFGNIGIYRPELFADCMPGHFRLGQLLFPAVSNGQMTGELYSGTWFNIGTPNDLIEAEQKTPSIIPA